MTTDPQLRAALSPWRGGSVVILGIGNRLKGDDAVGPLLCEHLADRLSAKVIDAGTAPENYLRPIREARPDLLLIVDAVDFGGEPGQARLFEPGQIHRFAFSTHALSLHLLLDLLGTERAIHVRVVGIQAVATGLGDDLSPAVRAAMEILADTLTELFRPAM